MPLDKDLTLCIAL
jgi:hypothetical protein